jgi:nucleotide-binding universal stress UspA family protein
MSTSKQSPGKKFKVVLQDPPRKILVPIDFSPCSLKAVGHALSQAKLSGAELILVHVVEPSHPGSMFETSQAKRMRNLALHNAKHELATIVREQIKPHVSARFLVKAGKPFEVISDLAARTASDLIVLGTHGHTGFPTVLLGSTAERVARRAPCPVLMVRQKSN